MKFLPQGILPIILGSIIAWIEHDRFDPLFFTFAFLGAAFIQIGLTMLNDALDYIYGTDSLTSAEKNPFSGGSGVLANRDLQPKDLLFVVGLLYTFAAAIGLYLISRIGIGIFWIALLGLFLSVFYSLKPLRLAFRGVGELAMLIGYGPTLTLGAYYVQTQTFSLTAVLASLVPGLLMWSMILINEIPDYKDDVRVNKMNLTVRYGPARIRWLYIASLSSVYLFISAGVVFRVFPASALLGLASLPFAISSFSIVYRCYLDQLAMIPANRAMVVTYSTTMLLFCIGFLVSNLL